MKASGRVAGILQRELPKPSKELAGVRSVDELQALLLVRVRLTVINCAALFQFSGVGNPGNQ